MKDARGPQDVWPAVLLLVGAGLLLAAGWLVLQYMTK